VLVDFMDNHDPTLEAMAKKRKKYYEEQGWTITTVDRPEDITWNRQK
jgi:hypothetical protein